MQATGNNHSLANLIRELRDETSTLMRQEVALAKAELTDKGRHLAKDSIAIVVGGVLALAALIFLLLGCRELLWLGLMKAGVSSEVALWFSPIIIAAVVGIIGWALIARGKKAMSREGVVPQKTVESLRENQYWLKHKLART